jgi:serpin B
MRIVLSLFLSVALAIRVSADETEAVAAINKLGLDLYRQLDGSANICLSPYSIQNALAMTYAGADGKTRSEMAKALHFPEDDVSLHASFAALQRELERMSARTVELAEQSKKRSGPSEPITFHMANGLFGQTGYDFREPFLTLVKDNYGARLKPLDFVNDSAGATRHINQWVEERTGGRIRDIIAGGLDRQTRLVLANAIYLKAPWAKAFSEKATKPEGFHVAGGIAVDVPTMSRHGMFGYAKREGFTAVGIPYSGGELQLLVLLPDEPNGLPALERKLTGDTFAECARVEMQDLLLHLPKFKIEPATISLHSMLRALGLKTAFDEPKGSANFERIAPRKKNDYLYISDVFHKTFINIDEKGTEAAAATVVRMLSFGFEGEPPKPIEIKVDRPFVFAIQHRPSGACLFIGRVPDPGAKK